jgi:predicted AAA+ superfamily ATPase
LVGVDDQLGRLDANVAAFVAGRPAHATLLYGPRGSGKSTAVRGLLARFADDGLRLAEVGADVGALPRALAALGPWPYPTLLVLDDLAFEDGEPGHRPLRSLLEGGLKGLPPRLLVVATSNRRHLVRERLRDRPDPLDDDVHAWDTHHERLALADRFGLVLTFPHVDRARYLTLVASLAEMAGLALPEDWQSAAVRFAERGNGYAGRTARQFVTEIAQGADVEVPGAS